MAEEIKMVVPTTGETVMIDKSIAPIILMFWQKGIETLFCCEGHSDGANGKFQTYIVFPLKYANALYRGMYDLLTTANDPDFIRTHFVITIDIFQDKIVIEAYGTQDNTWVRIMQEFYNLAKYARNAMCDKYTGVSNWIRRANEQNNFPHIQFAFFINYGEEYDNAEMYFMIDNQHIYSSWHDTEEIEENDELIIIPALSHPHENILTEDYINFISRVIPLEEAKKLFGFDPLE